MKKILTAALVLGAVILLVWLLTSRSGPSRALDLTEYNLIHELLNLSYQTAETVENPVLPDTLDPFAHLVTETITAEGVWSPDETITPEDTLKVEISVVEVAGIKFVRVEIENKPVRLIRVKEYEAEVGPGRWSGGLEAALLHGFDIGVYGAYRLGTVWGIHGDAAIVVDISDTPDWIAGELKISIPLWRTVETGPGGGVLLSREGIEGYGSFGIGVRF